MAAAKRKKPSARKPLRDEDEIPVRVSSRTPRAKQETPPLARAQDLAVGLLDATIGQLADYIESSHAVERLLKAQTRQVLREVAADPQLAALIRTLAQEFLHELTAHPETLEPLVRAQVDRYLANLEAAKPTAPGTPPPVEKPKRKAKQVNLE